MKPPKLEEIPVPVVAREDLQKLFAVCNVQSFEDRRDAAIIRVFLNTGARLGGMAGVRLEEVDLRQREVRVVGKGKKARDLPIGPKATKAVDRYLRERARHSQRDGAALRVGAKGRLTDSVIVQMIRRRCREAGIHRSTHTSSATSGPTYGSPRAVLSTILRNSLDGTRFRWSAVTQPQPRLNERNKHIGG